MYLRVVEALVYPGLTRPNTAWLGLGETPSTPEVPSCHGRFSRWPSGNRAPCADDVGRASESQDRIGAGVALAAAVGCSGGDEPLVRATSPSQRLDARPKQSARDCNPGVYDLTPATSRRALLHVTPSVGRRARNLLLALHGAGSGGAKGGLWIFRDVWQTPGLVIVAPAAAGVTWSLGSTDIDFVDLALRRAFARCRVDPRRVAVGGFSAGAGLALWLGLSNGDLFKHVLSLSPGATLPDRRVGKPRVFPAHGTRDRSSRSRRAATPSPDYCALTATWWCTGASTVVIVCCPS